MGKCVLGHMQTGRPKSGCVDTKSDQGLHCLLTESLDITEYMNGEKRSG